MSIRLLPKKVILFSFNLLDTLLRDSCPCLLFSVLASLCLLSVYFLHTENTVQHLIFPLCLFIGSTVVVLQELHYYENGGDIRTPV